MSLYKKTVSIVTPFYNEGEGIHYFYSSICEVFDSIRDINFEVVCIDDGSKDDTLERLVSIANKDCRFRVLELSRNFGKEAALTAGIDAASGDCVIPIDADLQDPPTLIPEMIIQWKNGAEVVLARRIDRQTDTFLKKTTAKLFYRLHNKMSDIKLPENVGDFRLMDRVVVEALKKMPEHHRFMKGLFAWVGFRSITLDYVRDARIAGETKFSGWKLWNFALEGISGFSTAPLKLWSYLGLGCSIITFLYGLFIVARVLIYGIEVPGYASLLIAVLFFGSLQLISIGILGEYIGRIYMETKNRPLYVVRRQYGVEQ